MWKSGDETGQQQYPIVRCQSRTYISYHDQRDEYQKNTFQRMFAGKYQHRCPYAYSQRIGRNKMSCLGDTDTEIMRHIGQNTHHDKLCDTQSQGTERQCDKTFLHISYTNLFTGGKITTIMKNSDQCSLVFELIPFFLDLCHFLHFVYSVFLFCLKTADCLFCRLKKKVSYAPYTTFCLSLLKISFWTVT